MATFAVDSAANAVSVSVDCLHLQRQQESHAFVVYALAELAIQAGNRLQTCAFNGVIEALADEFKGSRFLTNSERIVKRNLIAACFEHVAVGLKSCTLVVRSTFLLRLLELFCDTAERKHGNSSEADLLVLFPAIACAANDKVWVATVHDTVHSNLSSAKSIFKLYCLFWFCIGKYNLLGVRFGTKAFLEISSSTQETPLCSLGKATPLLSCALYKLSMKELQYCAKFSNTTCPASVRSNLSLLLSGTHSRVDLNTLPYSTQLQALSLGTLVVSRITSALDMGQTSWLPFRHLFEEMEVLDQQGKVLVRVLLDICFGLFIHFANVTTSSDTLGAHVESILMTIQGKLRQPEALKGAIRLLECSAKAFYSKVLLSFFFFLKCQDGGPISTELVNTLLQCELASKYLSEMKGFRDASSNSPSYMEAVLCDVVTRPALTVATSTGGCVSVTELFSHFDPGDSSIALKGLRAVNLKARILGLISEQLRAPTVWTASSNTWFVQGAAVLISRPRLQDVACMVQTVSWMVAQCFSLEGIESAIFSWNWLLASAPDMQIPLVSGICDAWLWTAERQLGMFTDQANPKNTLVHLRWMQFFIDTWKLQLQTRSVGSHVFLSQQFHYMLSRSLCCTLSCQPAAVGAQFQLLRLSLLVAASLGQETKNAGVPLRKLLMWKQICSTALNCLKYPQLWNDQLTSQQKGWNVAALKDFSVDLMSLDWPEFVDQKANVLCRIRVLLQHLIEDEHFRINMWTAPLDSRVSITRKEPRWRAMVSTAWDTAPDLAFSMLLRFPSVPLVKSVKTVSASCTGDPILQALPCGAVLHHFPCTVGTDSHELFTWSSQTLYEALGLLFKHPEKDSLSCSYLLRSLRLATPQEGALTLLGPLVAFMLPQLVQLLRYDTEGLIQSFLLLASQSSTMFAYRLICTLKAEGTPPLEAQNPTVKRAGWRPPLDTGLWTIADTIAVMVWQGLHPAVATLVKSEIEFFDAITSVSGLLFNVPKGSRKNMAVKHLAGVALPREGIFMPTSFAFQVKKLLAESATPMQSAAKVPLLVAFDVVKSGQTKEEEVKSCIFKVGDDCRQDVLALQVTELLKTAFQQAGLDIFVCTYGVLPTAYQCGIVEVVPNAKSRSALGETSDGGLFDIFCQEFGNPGTPSFESARMNFIRSLAGSAIASYVLQAKDRHNGNILLDSEGHLVHIDFGFILDISPGANMGFENAAFKMSNEMTLLVDPGQTRTSTTFAYFCSLCVRGFLAVNNSVAQARDVSPAILATVALMRASGLPCFERGDSVNSLEKRLLLTSSRENAAKHMLHLINDSYDKWTTGFYDLIQFWQNAIPK